MEKIEQRGQQEFQSKEKAQEETNDEFAGTEGAWRVMVTLSVPQWLCFQNASVWTNLRELLSWNGL